MLAPGIDGSFGIGGGALGAPPARGMGGGAPGIAGIAGLLAGIAGIAGAAVARGANTERPCACRYARIASFTR
jgi:hypothetical protein